MRLEAHQVRRRFERAADRYDQLAGLQREMAERLIGRLDYIRIQPRQLLDLGCGTGWMTGQLRRRYPKARLLALDFAPAMLRQARRQGSWLKPIHCVCADAQALPLAAQSQDLLISNAMLQWCDPPQRVFEEWLRVLRPGGLLLFASFAVGSLAELEWAWAQVDDRPHVSPFADMHDLGDALLGLGWENPVLDIDRFTLHYASVHELMADLKGLGAANARADRHRGLTGKGRIRALAEAYEARRTPAGLPLSYEVVYGLAWAPQQRQLGGVTQIPLAGLNLAGGHD
ncbi:MAG: malonyl-ACP O-methyltransferase BioC [Gammaproteobacteria bacterium SHHR-1]|uniref:malonyl-ACP O-methyltransferase BioC n=1 Tax=Magnetovirga frankeli TaxID=947516 RepID=UPI001293F054|nr:malonyl-ACP O-methyltransferase BioC [gamma proteobacterium SS-5]